MSKRGPKLTDERMHHFVVRNLDTDNCFLIHRSMQVCQRVAPLFEAEPRTVLLQSPVYVFGDIHGNLEV